MRPLGFLLLLIGSATLAVATSVRPPEFPELVEGAELIFRGEVVAVDSSWQGEGTARHVATRVRFHLEKVLKGAADAELTLEFLGGQVSARRLTIAGMPRFAVGERVVCFVEERTGRLCPVRRLGYGRYRVVADGSAAGTERILRDDGAPLIAIDGVKTPLAHEAPGARARATAEAMSLADFESAIAAQIHSTPAATR